MTAYKQSSNPSKTTKPTYELSFFPHMSKLIAYTHLFPWVLDSEPSLSDSKIVITIYIFIKYGNLFTLKGLNSKKPVKALLQPLNSLISMSESSKP